MALQLRSLANHEVFPLCGERHLIVRAGPAGCTFLASPRATRVALLFRHAEIGWVLHDLRATPTLLHNGHRVRRCRLAAGDQLRLAGTVFRVEPSNVPEAPAAAVETNVAPGLRKTGLSDAPRCRLLFRTGTATEVHEKQGADVIIGAAPRCDVVCGPRVGLSPRHWLLACTNGEWHLHDLSGKGLRRGDSHADFMVVRDGDVLQVGPVSVTFRFTALDSGEGLAAEAPATSDVVAAETLAGDGPPIPAPAAATPAPPSTDPVLQAAETLWHRLRARPAGPIPRITALEKVALTVQRWSAEARFRSGDAIDAFRIVEECLRRDPRNRETLLSLARFFEQLGYFPLCLAVIEVLHDLYPTDALVTRSLIKLTRHLGLSLRAVATNPPAKG
jgi:hypothetical protein